MPDTIAVINAGSSSIKFTLFSTQGETLVPNIRGQIESLSTSPRFVAKAPDGAQIAEKRWPEGVKLDHDEALDFLIGYPDKHPYLNNSLFITRLDIIKGNQPYFLHHLILFRRTALLLLIMDFQLL